MCRARSVTVAALLLPVICGLLPAGCVSYGGPFGTAGPGRAGVKHRALECLRAAVGYKHNAAVRVAAVEGLEASGLAEVRPWIRLALLDGEPAVRFAGCTAAGRLQDDLAMGVMRESLSDPNASVRAAALFALHRLGDSSRTGELAGYLLSDPQVTVRRNAAMLLGMLGERGAVRVLARAMFDKDEGVRQYALEAMARLGNVEARQELIFMTNAGIGEQETFALHALAATREMQYRETFAYKLETAGHLETRLAAARGLGLLGSDAGFAVALRALGQRGARTRDPVDPPEDQELRVRVMAAAALGAIGKTEALPALDRVLQSERDPRLKVAAAAAILRIVKEGASPMHASR